MEQYADEELKEKAKLVFCASRNCLFRCYEHNACNGICKEREKFDYVFEHGNLLGYDEQ